MGKGSAPSEQNITQTNLPEYVRPQFEALIKRAEGLSEADYQAFPGQRVATAGMGDITSAYDMTRGVAGAGVPGLSQAMGVAGSNIAAGQALGQQAGQQAQFGQAGFSQFSPAQFSGFQAGTASPFTSFSEAQAQEFGFDPTGRFTGSAVQEYMSPYMQAVVDEQSRRAMQQFDEQRGERSARAVQAGAFGGSRQAVQEGIAERGLLDRLSGIQAEGSQQAFQQAAEQFGADRAADFARQQAQAGEAARTQGIGAQEAARVQEARAQEMARVQGITIDEARRVQESQAQEAARVQGIQAGELGRVEAAQAAEAARVQAARAAEQRAAIDQQLQALGFSSQQAQQLADLGGVQRASEIQGAQLLESIGSSQRAMEQQQLDVDYQDFLRQQAYPEQQMQFLSSILRGVPVQPTVMETAYAPFNPAQQLAGAGLTGIGLYRGLQ